MNNENLIFQIAVPGPFTEPLDYLPPNDFIQQNEDNLIGRRVKVPLRNKEVIGILVNIQSHSHYALNKLKRAFSIIDEEPVITSQILKLTRWASDYYHHPLGDVILSALPVALRQGKSLEKKEKKTKENKRIKEEKKIKEDKVENELPLILNTDQENAFKTIVESFFYFRVFLLYGITGSGKTEVYLHAINKALENKKQALILVPEIGLTPQTFFRFQQRFNVPMAILHSGLSEKEKLTSWLSAKENQVSLIVGTRSAIFTPIPNLGLIIIDEEHDLSFKQQEGFRYSARDLSLLRAQFENIPIILGSATPSLETLYKAYDNHYHLLRLTERAGGANLPSLKLIDIRKQKLTAGLSELLLNGIKKHLEEGNQVLLFLNRRGFSPSLLCHLCAYVARCHRCDAYLTYHLNPERLCCHHCSYESDVYSQCPQCHGDQWIMLGQGTQKIESTLQSLFPEYPIIRVDRDNTRRKGAMKNLLHQIHQGEGKILIGTQMLAKGHHFPDVTLVAILDVDTGLSSSDFRATERMAQLIVQVAGRSGRALRRGEVLLQTHFPDHALLNLLISKGYLAFAMQALEERKEAQLPPYQFLALLRAEATQQVYPFAFLKEVTACARPYKNQITILGPIPSLMEKRAGRFRAQVLFQADKRSTLHAFLNKLLPEIKKLKSAKKVRYILDIDPQEML